MWHLMGKTDFSGNQPSINVDTVYGVKRFLGRQFTDETVTEDKDTVPYNIVGEDGKIKVEVQLYGKSKKFLPEEISAFVLSHMKQISEKYLEEEVTSAVVTVPAYFNNSQRQPLRALLKLQSSMY